jgi:hypothetical protein
VQAPPYQINSSLVNVWYIWIGVKIKYEIKLPEQTLLIKLEEEMSPIYKVQDKVKPVLCLPIK